jgi:hypothetical protein
LGRASCWPKFKTKIWVTAFAQKNYLRYITRDFFFFFSALSESNTHSIFFYTVIPVLLVVLAWSVLIVLDRLNKRNVWVYRDHIIISHSGDRLVLPKTGIKKIVIYSTKNVSLRAVEFLLDNRKAIVVGVPKEIETSTILEIFNNLGYLAQNDL